MKVQLLTNIEQAGTGLKFFKGRTYSAIAASNLPGFARYNAKGPVLKKIFVERDGQSMLVEKPNFRIVEASKDEAEEIIVNLLASHLKPKREKLIAPQGFKLRVGFRVFPEDEQLALNICTCAMGKGGQNCGKPAYAIRENRAPSVGGKLGKIMSRTILCKKCAIIPAGIV